MARVLVTGGAGYVGSVCAAQLLARGNHVEVVDDLSTGHREAVPNGAIFHRFDISDRARLSTLLRTKSFDIVFHFAAKALIAESVSNPGVFFDSNVASGISMLEALRAHGIRKFVFSSTAAVYGTPTVVPTPEEHATEPVNAYGESKLMLERILKWYASAYGWSVVAFRYFNACGGSHDWGERHEPETHIIPLLLQAASGRRRSFDIYGCDYSTSDGTCQRDYVHVFDIADAHLLAMQKFELGKFRAYNIGTGQSHSVKEVHEAAEKITGKRIEVHFLDRRPGDPPALCASPQRLVDEFGWKPTHSNLHNILTGAWKWEQHQSNQALREIAARP
jgi:UDP-glucose 4-epimerase